MAEINIHPLTDSEEASEADDGDFESVQDSPSTTAGGTSPHSSSGKLPLLAFTSV